MGGRQPPIETDHRWAVAFLTSREVSLTKKIELLVKKLEVARLEGIIKPKTP